MKRLLILLALTIPLMGCPANTSTVPMPATLAPGYLNSADQAMGEILAGARSFYISIQNQSSAGTLTLDPTTKKAFNSFGVVLNGAESVYLAYHNGAATQAEAQTAVNQVQAQQAALPLPGAKP